MSETFTNRGRRVDGRMIAYDDRLDVSVFLTDDDRVVVYDGRTQRVWTVSEPEQELHDWLPPGQYALAISVLRRFAVVPDGN